MRIVFLMLFLLLASPSEAQPGFVVFFDWNQATLTPQSRQTIHQAADTALRSRASIEVDGFTDTSGTPQYNQALSSHRAQVVAAELQHDGVPPAAIHIRSFGENYLRQPTPDDVRDPQNRRVALIIHAPPPPPVVVAPPPPPPVVYAPVPIYPPVYPWGWYGYPRGYGYGYGARYGWYGYRRGW